MQSFLDEELVEHETTGRDVEHLFPMMLWRFCDKFVTMQQQNTTTTTENKTTQQTYADPARNSADTRISSTAAPAKNSQHMWPKYCPCHRMYEFVVPRKTLTHPENPRNTSRSQNVVPRKTHLATASNTLCANRPISTTSTWWTSHRRGHFVPTAHRHRLRKSHPTLRHAFGKIFSRNPWIHHSSDEVNSLRFRTSFLSHFCWGACKTGRVQVRAFRGRNKKQERVVKCLHECWHGSSTHRLQIAASFLGHALRLGRKSMGWSSWSVWSSGRSSRLILGFLWIFQGTWVSRAGSQWMWRTRKLLRSWRTECVRKLIMWYQSEHVILCNIHIFTLLSKCANNSSIGFENIRHCVEFLTQY